MDQNRATRPKSVHPFLPKESSGGWPVDTEVPVGVLDLSARPTTAIQRLGIHSVSQLMNFPRQEFCDVHGVGAKSVAEVQSKLFNYLSGAPLRIFASHEGKESTLVSKPVGTRSLVNAMLHRLTKQQRDVISNRYGLSNGTSGSLRGIGRKSGLSGEWIRQIEKKGLTRLHGMCGHGVLSGIVARKIGNYLNADAEVRCGVLTRDEAVSCMADDCSQEQAAVALSLFNDIECPAGDILTRHLLEAEPGVYCVSKTIACGYTQLLKLIERALQEKPASESRLRDEILGQAENALTTEQLKLMERMLSISPSVTRLADGEFALSRWIEFKGRSTRGRAEVALLQLGRPAHFWEIWKHIQTLFKNSRGVHEHSVLKAFLQTPQTFVRVGKGTYGLKVWGLRALPCRRKRATA